MSDADGRDRAAATLRARMVREQLASRDIDDERVLAAMAKVPRHDYVPGAPLGEAYADHPVSIGEGATISQPYIVALMSQALRLAPGDRVLEVGTGSGYGAAVLAELAEHVTTVERIGRLADSAATRLARYGERVHVVTGDGALGYPDSAPYDAISVTAAAPVIPVALLDQLAPGGRLVMPVGRRVERLTRVTRTADGDVTDVIASVRFVPLVAGSRD